MFLPQVAEDIGSEVKFQRDFLEQVVCDFAVLVIFCLFRILDGERRVHVEGLDRRLVCFMIQAIMEFYML